MTSPTSSQIQSIADAKWLGWPETQTVFEALSGEGAVTRAVGGAVRDTLMGVPVGDVDLATTAPPQSVIELAGSAGLKAVPTGIEHGTVTIIAGKRSFEVTTLRCDVETHGRRATVAFTEDWQEDARRRDFTINALYANSDGTLYDPLGGLADLEVRRVRFIGEAAARIREDYLRILRFFRFNAEFGSPPYCPEGLHACVQERGGLDQLSGERVRAEMMLVLKAPGAVDALDAMFGHGLLSPILGGVALPLRFQRLIAAEDELAVGADAVRRLFALAVLVREDVERLGRKLRLSNAETKRLGELLIIRTLDCPVNEQQAKAAIYGLGAAIFRNVNLLGLAQSFGPEDRENWLAAFDLSNNWLVPVFPLSGSDLADLGVPKGPRVGKLLAVIEHEWIEREFDDDRTALIERAGAIIAALNEADGKSPA